MAHDLAAVKDYMRIDDQDLEDQEKATQEAVIKALIAGAVEYLGNAGIPEPGPEEVSELYDLAVKALTLHWYDHRDDVGNESAVPNGVRPVITQLKLLWAVKRAGGVT